MVRKAVTRQTWKPEDQNSVTSLSQESVSPYTRPSLQYADVADSSGQGSSDVTGAADLFAEDASGFMRIADLVQGILSGKRLGSLCAVLSGTLQLLQKLRLCWDPGSLNWHAGGHSSHDGHTVHNSTRIFTEVVRNLANWPVEWRARSVHIHAVAALGMWRMFQDAVGSYFKRRTADLRVYKVTQ